MRTSAPSSIRTLGESMGKPVDVAGGAVVDDGDPSRSVHPFLLSVPYPSGDGGIRVVPRIPSTTNATSSR
jgi:hypothetical protein